MLKAYHERIKNRYTCSCASSDGANSLLDSACGDVILITCSSDIFDPEILCVICWTTDESVECAAFSDELISGIAVYIWPYKDVKGTVSIIIESIYNEFALVDGSASREVVESSLFV